MNLTINNTSFTKKEVEILAAIIGNLNYHDAAKLTMKFTFEEVSGPMDKLYNALYDFNSLKK